MIKKLGYIDNINGGKMSNNKKFPPSIGIWKGKYGHYISHAKGLTPEQVEFLKSLNEGDRIILFEVTPKEGKELSEKAPTLNLKKYIPKQSNVDSPDNTESL